MIESLTFLGGRCITSLSTGSTPRLSSNACFTSQINISIDSTQNLCAGGPSMIILIHNICMAFRGFRRCSKVEIVIKDNAAMLLSVNQDTTK